MIHYLRPIERVKSPEPKLAPQPHQSQWPLGTPLPKGPADAKRRW